jgi:hypothetical protein
MPDRALHKPVVDDIERPLEDLDLADEVPELDDMEAPPDDALEQRRPVRPPDEQFTPNDLPAEADPADVIDQRVPVSGDEDDYR